MESKKGAAVSSLETPCLLLNRELMERNFNNLNKRLQDLGVKLRLHVKTAKSIKVVNTLLKDAKNPIAVSTLKEAEEFAKAGFTDIVYAVGISPNKLQRVQKIRAGGVMLKVILDSVEQAKILSKYTQETKDPIQVLIEVDSDGHRSGIKPNDSDTIFKIASTLKNGGAKLEGLLIHAGESYHAKSDAEIAAIAEQERQAAVDVTSILRAYGFKVPIVSVGSTPTAYFAKDLTGVTEVRAGVFVFSDLVMAGLGVYTPSDIAISVLTTVIGHQAEKGWIIVDAGWMAMSGDRGTAGQKIDQGYGLACDEHGNVIEDLTMIKANQEHGILAFRDGRKDVRERFPVGTMLRILPNHACATAAQYQEYCVVEDGRVVDIWPRFNGW